MASDLKIVFAVFELAGIVITGGLANAVGTPGSVIAERKNAVRVIIPAYQQVLSKLKTTVASTDKATTKQQRNMEKKISSMSTYDREPPEIIKLNFLF